MCIFNLGTSTCDITPPVGVRLWGYDPRPSESVGHALRAEAIACGSQQDGWVLISADIGAFMSPFAREIVSAIAERLGLSEDAILLAATHTHSGPFVTDAVWNVQNDLEAAYYDDFKAKLIDLAVKAWSARAPGKLVTARTEARELASNRRVQDADGNWINKWSDPEGVHTGYFDPTVDLLGVQREDGRLEALLVNYGCHPVSFNMNNRAISGDYVSYLKDALEASGRVETALFSVGCHANIDPRHGVQTEESVVREMGESLAEAVLAALPALQPIRCGGTGAAVTHWRFTTTWEETHGRMDYFPHTGPGQEAKTAFRALGAGELALVGLPGETVSEYRERLEGRSPFAKTFVLSLANDFVGYLPTDAILAEGAYEAALCPVTPIESDILQGVDTVLASLQKKMNGK